MQSWSLAVFQEGGMTPGGVFLQLLSLVFIYLKIILSFLLPFLELLLLIGYPPQFLGLGLDSCMAKRGRPLGHWTSGLPEP